MKGQLFSFVRFAAHLCRNMSAIGAVFFAVRFTWLTGAEYFASARERLVQAGDSKKGPADVLGAPRVTRPDPAKLAKDFGGEAPLVHELPVPEAALPSGPVLRRILVDLGPERSEVFLDGRRVGQTPYLGQVSCTNGARLRVEVLPRRGAPIKRIIVCQGTQLVAAREPKP